MRHTFLGRVKSIAGAAFIGVGVFVLYNNVDQAFSSWNDQLARIGTLPTVALGALRVFHAYGPDHHRFVQGLFQHGLVAFWPLLLVIAGTALSKDEFAGDAEASAKKDRRIVDLTVRRSTLK